MTNIILSSFQISKGIKSIGPKGLLPANSHTKKPLIIQQIENIKSIFGKKKHKTSSKSRSRPHKNLIT